MDSSKNDDRGTPEEKQKDVAKDKDQSNKPSGSKTETRRKENVEEKQRKKKKEKSPSTSKRPKSEKEKERNNDERKDTKYDRQKHKNPFYGDKRKVTRDPDKPRKLGEAMYTKTEPVISYRFNLSFENEPEKQETSSKRRKMSKSDRRSVNEDANSSKDVKEDKDEKAKRKSYIDANKLSFQPEEMFTNSEQSKKDAGLIKKNLEKIQDTKPEESPKKVKQLSKDCNKKTSVAEETKIKDKPSEKVPEKKLETQGVPKDDSLQAENQSPKDGAPKKEEIVISEPVEVTKKESSENIFANKWEDDDSQPPFCNKPNPITAPINKVDVNPSLYDDEISLDNQTEESRDSMDDVFGGREILKNPSPPPNFVADEFEVAQNVPQKTENTVANASEPSRRSIDKVKRMPITPLFGIEDIYQQFMKNVKTSVGFDLDSKSSGIDTSSCISNVTSTDKSKSSSSSSSSSSDSEESDSSTSSSSSSSSSTSSSSSSSSTSTSKSSSSKRDEVPPSKSDSHLKAKEAALNKGTLHDLKMLESLQKGHDIVKEMEKSDKTTAKTDQSKCLNEVEKYLETTKRHLMEVDARKNNLPAEMEKVQIKIEPNASPVRVLLTEKEIKKEVTDSSDDEGDESPTNERERDMLSPPLKEGDGLSINREAIKIKISPHSKKQVKATEGNKNTETEDIDFTEKLLKTTKSSKDENTDREEVQKVKRKLSVSPYREKSGSPKHKEKEKPRDSRSRSRSHSRSRSSSVSPSRRDRKSPSASPRSKRQSHSTRHKRSYGSPPPRRSRHDSPTARRHNDSYRSKRRSVSPPRRRSRSPYYDRRRYSRSPPYRPPSPKDGSPPKDRRRSVSPRSGGSPSHYNSSSDATMQYSSHDYYYVQQNQVPSDQNSQVHQQYSDYYSNYDYSNCPPEYINSQMSDYTQYGSEYSNTGDPAEYNQIPVIGQSYYYNDYENIHNFGSAQENVKLPRNSSKTEIVQHDDLTGKSSTVAVQKGNVLEIVPASNVAASVPSNKEPEPIKKEIDTQTEQREEIKSEFGTKKDSSTAISDDELARKIDEKEKRRERKKRRKQLKNHMRTTFQEEISRRLSICTVNRINKEGDSLRSILANQTNSPIPPLKEKKKVLFADGVPPGHSSSASDDEMIQRRILKKRLKKKRRKEEDKENTKQNMLSEDEIKIDPELEKLPPPPPPPGSPPSCLPQPVLKRPPSPEQLVYFHYDIVVDSMFISTNPIPIPPRLQNPNEDPQAQQGNSVAKQQNTSRPPNMSHMSANTTINKVSYSNANKVASSSPNQASKKKTNVEPKDCSPRPPQQPQVPPTSVHPSPSQSSSTSTNSPNASSPIVKANVNPPANVFSHPQPFRPQQASVTQTQPPPPILTSQPPANPENSLRASATMRPVTRPQGPAIVQNPSQSSPSGNNTPQRPSSLPSHGSPLVSNVPSPISNAASPIPGLNNQHAQSPCGFPQPSPLQSPGAQTLQSPVHGPTTGPPPNFIPPPMNAQNVNMLRPHCPPFAGNMSQMPPHMQQMRMPMMMHGPGPGHCQSPRGQSGPPPGQSPNQQMSMPPNMMFNRPRFPPRMMEPSGPRNPYPMQLPNPQMPMPNPQMSMPMPFSTRFNEGQFPDQFSTPNYNPNIPPPYIKNRGPRQKFHTRPQSFNTEIRPQNFNPEMRQKNFRPQSFNTEIRPHAFPTDNRQQ